MDPTLSVIIPVYNTEQYLKKCIESVLSQEYKDYEIILVDDGSTDTSPAICDYYAQQFSSFIQVIHKANAGVMSARKLGLNVACGKYISFIDSDDWVEPRFYNVFFSHPQLNCDAIILAGHYEEGLAADKKICTKLKKGLYNKLQIKQILERGEVIPSLWLKIFKKELIQSNIQLVHNCVWRGEDFLCSYACLADASIIMVYKSYQYHYVQHEASAVHHYSDRNIKNMYAFAANAREIGNIKNISFLNSRWNQQILQELLYIIDNEFQMQQDSHMRKEKLCNIRLSRLLIHDKGKRSINERNKEERTVLKLFECRLFGLLGIYLRFKNRRYKN